MRWIILLAIALIITGILVTLFLGRDSQNSYNLIRIATIMLVVCIVALLFLQKQKLVLATITLSLVLYAGTTGMLVPYGVGNSSIGIVGFLIPLVLLSQLWGLRGALIALNLTGLSYDVLIILTSLGMAGWERPPRVPVVQFSYEMVGLILSGLIIGLYQLQVQKVNQRLEQTNNELHIANQKLQIARQQLGDFTAGVAHDLTTPVQVIYEQLAGLENHRRRIIAEQLALISSFVEHTKVFLEAYKSSRSRLRHEPVSLLSIAASAMSAATVSQPIHRNVSIYLDCPANLRKPHALGDSTAIRRVVDNLLRNAVGISPNDSIVTIRIREVEEGYIELSIIDKGPGISLEDQQYIFDPYWSSSSGRKTGTGWGLGLAIVRQLTNAMGGCCGITSSPGSGSTFWVRLKQCQPS